MLSYKARRRLSLLILLVGLPVYVVIAVNVIAMFERPSILIEVIVYVSLGVLWAFPFKYVFRGVGQAEPDHD